MGFETLARCVYMQICWPLSLYGPVLNFIGLTAHNTTAGIFTPNLRATSRENGNNDQMVLIGRADRRSALRRLSLTEINRRVCTSGDNTIPSLPRLHAWSCNAWSHLWQCGGWEAEPSGWLVHVLVGSWGEEPTHVHIGRPRPHIAHAVQ